MNTSNACITIAAEALAIEDYGATASPDDGGERPKILPMAGDPIDLHVKGAVEKVEGGQATVRIAFVNGRRVAAPAAEEISGEPDDDEAAMRELAGAADDAAEEEYL